MMPENWLKPEQIQIVQPQTAEQVEALRADIEELIRQFPSYDEDFVDWVKHFPKILTLVYVDDEPVAYIRLDSHAENPYEVGKKSLEFSGCVVPEFRDRGLTQQVAPIVINKAFRPGIKKIIAKAHKTNSEACFALNQLGFVCVGTEVEDPDIRIYRLTKGQSDAHIQKQTMD